MIIFFLTIQGILIFLLLLATGSCWNKLAEQEKEIKKLKKNLVEGNYPPLLVRRGGSYIETREVN